MEAKWDRKKVVDYGSQMGQKKSSGLQKLNGTEVKRWAKKGEWNSGKWQVMEAEWNRGKVADCGR